MLCPHCLSDLKLVNTFSTTYDCPHCGGKWKTFATFKERVGDDHIYESLLNKAQSSEEHGKSCPQCLAPMKVLRTPENNFKLDLCFHCQHVWFGFSEYENFKVKGDSLGDAFLKLHQQLKKS